MVIPPATTLKEVNLCRFPLQPLQVPSLKAACVQQLEHLILSGKLKINEKLPPERELAAQLQVSRPVIHEAIVDLAAKGLVTIIPRQHCHQRLSQLRILRPAHLITRLSRRQSGSSIFHQSARHALHV